jgi:hypothetical protein
MYTLRFAPHASTSISSLLCETGANYGASTLNYSRWTFTDVSERGNQPAAAAALLVLC